MNKRYLLKIFIFAFAVSIVLLRPFCVYHLATSPGFPKEPYKVERLLRALIKKKNDHAADTEDVMELSTARKYLPLATIFLMVLNKMFWFFSLLSISHFIVKRR